jgi:hypothetical protein
MKRSSALAFWAGLTAVYALHAGVLMLCGGDWGWWQAWAYSLLFALAGIGMRLWAERRHPGLMAERAQLARAPGVKSWDRLLAPLMALSLGLPLFVVAGLDHRFGWSPDFPSWLSVLGLVLAAAGYGSQGGRSWRTVSSRLWCAFNRSVDTWCATPAHTGWSDTRATRVAFCPRSPWSWHWTRCGR